MHTRFYEPITIKPTKGRILLAFAKAVTVLTGRGFGIWRMVNFGSRFFRSWENCPVVGPDGKEFWLDLRRDGFGLVISGWCVSEIEPTLHRLNPDAVILDIGANIGIWARLFSAHVPSGRVYAFEPSPTTFRRLERNCSVASNISCICAAVGEKTGQIGFSPDECDPVLRHIEPEIATTDSLVRVWNLGDWVAAEKISRIDLIKIDVEGFEEEIIVPSINVICRFRPFVVFEFIEMFASSRSRFKGKRLFEIFREVGYSVYRLDKSGVPHQDFNVGKDWTNDYVAISNLSREVA